MNKSKILVVDDEEIICEMTKAILERTGKFEVVFTTKAADAVSVAKKVNPHVILLDLMMPEMDGSDVAVLLGDNPATRNIPVIFVTALVRKTEVVEGEGTIGRESFISKPIVPEELIARIEETLGKAH